MGLPTELGLCTELGLPTELGLCMELGLPTELGPGREPGGLDPGDSIHTGARDRRAAGLAGPLETRSMRSPGP